MTSEEKKQYTARVVQANRTELVVIIYELILDSVNEAEKAYNAGETEQGEEHVKKAQAYLKELVGSLDMQYEISANLRQLYRYVNEQLIHTIIRRKPVNFTSVTQVLSGLMDSFAQIAKEDSSTPVMGGQQQVYAGLTYGKGTLTEYSTNGNGEWV